MRTTYMAVTPPECSNLDFAHRIGGCTLNHWPGFAERPLPPEALDLRVPPLDNNFAPSERAFFATVLNHAKRLQDEFHVNLKPFEKIANALFFRGGSLAQHGLKVSREAAAAGRPWGVIGETLQSFTPQHEDKALMVGAMLFCWTEPHVETEQEVEKRARHESKISEFAKQYGAPPAARQKSHRPKRSYRIKKVQA